jgi:uroporphyrinogen decarboxylase
MVHYCLDRLYELAYISSRRLYETLPGCITHSFVAEDMGSQEDLIFSPPQVREFFLPWMRKMIELVRQAGVAVFHHSDGAIRKIIPDMIEAGSQVLNPIQWRCKGMDRQALTRDFGDRLVFHGGVDNQRTLAFGTVEDVRNEVLDPALKSIASELDALVKEPVPASDRSLPALVVRTGAEARGRSRPRRGPMTS